MEKLVRCEQHAKQAARPASGFDVVEQATATALSGHAFHGGNAKHRPKGWLVGAVESVPGLAIT